MKRISSRDLVANDAENKPELQHPTTKMDKTWDGMNNHEKLPNHIKNNKNKIHSLTNNNKAQS